MLRILSSFSAVCIVTVMIFLPYGLGMMLVESFPDDFIGVSGAGEMWLIGFMAMLIGFVIYAAWWYIKRAIYEYLKERRCE